MPPKATSRNRKSEKKIPELIPIYDMLADKQQQDVIRQVSKKMESLAKHDMPTLQKSLFICIIKICSLQQCIDKINWRQSIESLSEILQSICEQNQKSIYINQLFLINQKSKFHKEFVKRVKNLLDVLFSQQLLDVSDTDILKIVYDVLLTISKCKMRNIRHCSVVLSGLVMKSLIRYYHQLKAQKLNKKASKIISLIDEKYLDQFIKPRLKDIDSQIRQKSFEIVGDTLITLQDQLVTCQRLHKYYTQTMSDNKTKITQLALRSIIKMFQIDKQKMSLGGKKNLNTYANELIKPLQQLALLPNRNSCYAMDTLLAIHSFNSTLNSLKPRIISKIFQIHGYEKFQQGLKKAVSVFFKSLINFNTKQQLNQHCSVLIIQITHLLCSINSTKLLSTILQQFFIVYTSLFNFDEMFLLLLTGYYHRDGSDIELQQKQLIVLCTMICQFNIYLRNNKNTADRQKLQLSFNKTVLTNCKQIFYEKIPKYASLCHLYLRLFVLLYTPISGNITNYLSFVQQKNLNFIKQQQYLTIIGTTTDLNQHIVLIQQIIHECAAISSTLGRQSNKYQIVNKHFRVDQLKNKDKLDNIDVIKATALVSKFEIKQLLGQYFFKKILNAYNKAQTKIIKLQSLSYMFHCHKHLFTSLFEQPSLDKYTDYTAIRTAFIDFIIHMVLASNSQDTVVKLAAFNILCRSLRMISNSKIIDLSGVYFEPNQQQFEVLYEFIGQFISFQEEEVSQTTMMIATMGLETQQVRQQILQNLFLVFGQCLKISLNKLSIIFMTKLMLTNSLVLKPAIKYFDSFVTQLIKSEISTQNNNRFIFWRLFSQIIQQIPIQDEQVMNKIMTKLVQSYYKNKRIQSQSKSLLNNKLMLYVADYIDKSINNSRFQCLTIVKYLLSKTYRRFGKQILQRLLIFYTSKIVSLEDKNVKIMKDFLTKISKVGRKTKDKADNFDDNQSSSSQSQQNQKQQQNQDNQNNKDQGQQNIMVQKTPLNQNKRNTRSKTKRKNI